MAGYGPGSQVRVSAALAAPIAEALSYVGADAEELLENIGLSLAALELEGARITHSQWLTLLERSTALSGDPAFALRAAECLRPHALGLGRYIAGSPGAIGEAHGGVAPLFRKHHESLAIELDDLGNEVHCRFRFTAGLPIIPELSEYLLASVSVLGRALMDRLYQAPIEVRFKHAARCDVAPYRNVFGCQVRFSQAQEGIVFPREHEVLPLFRTPPTGAAT
jgi:hypothetical protein